MGVDIEKAANLLQEYYGVSAQGVSIYARLWQLETWLREMVYVELKSARGADWAASLKPVDDKLLKDKRLIHMATPQRGPLGYLTLGELWEVISSATNWPLFQCYFPPKHLVEAKLTTELLQIRHRVAHCRTPHTDDLARVEQFLRDIDQSFWKFTTSYNDEHQITPSNSDPVAAVFIDYDQYPWVEVESNTWTRLGRKQMDARYTITVALTVRPWVDKSSLQSPIAPNPGVLYDINFQALGPSSLNYEEILGRTKRLHDRCIHLVLDEVGQSVRLTFPSVLPAEKIIETVELFRKNVLRAVRSSAQLPKDLGNIIASRWPEYVIGPSNPLTFLCPDMPCKFFPA
jgi:hypothetical protein